GAPDVFTISTHFLAKGAIGPVTYRVRSLGGGRRLTSHLVEGIQNGRTITTSLLSLGDRETIEGPQWQQRTAPDLDGRVGPAAGTSEEPFRTPASAQQLGLRIDGESVPFAQGRVGSDATIRAVID